MKIRSLEEALSRIEELEKENKELKKELEYYKSRKISGRQRHNQKWMDTYDEVVGHYNSGSSIEEIAEKTGLSVRTVYRYKSYYDAINESLKNNMVGETNKN